MTPDEPTPAMQNPEKDPEEWTTGEEPMTLERIGERFGLTRERIRQLEAKALAKLRHPSRSGALLIQS